MSGIYIPDRPMPEHCGECFSYHALFGRDICWCGNGRRIELKPNERPDWCPLIPVPDHGRLIDANALENDLKRQCEQVFKLGAVSPDDYYIERREAYMQATWRSWCESFYDYLDTRPTVIEADKEEEP